MARLTSDYIVANGIHLPTKRRAYTRGNDRRANPGNANGLDRYKRGPVRVAE